MATGTQGLLTLRGALGATEGAATTPTRFLYPGVPGNVDLSGIQQFETIEDRVAWAKREPMRSVYAGIESNQVVLSNVPASFEDAGFYMATIVGVASGSTGLGGNTPTTTDTSAYTRAFQSSQTSTTVGSAGGYDLHLQVGTADLISTVGWSIPGLRCTDYSISFTKPGTGTDTGVTFGGTWVTPKTATQITSFTGSLSDRTQTLAVGQNNYAYVDSSSGSLGGTGDTNIIRATFQLTQNPAFHDGFDGTALPTSMHFPEQWTSTLTITRKFSDTTELAAWLARTTRAIRIENVGAQIGAVSAKNTIRCDFVGKPTSHVHTWEQNGILYANIGLQGIYDSTLGASWKLTTINSVSAAYTSA